MTLMGPCWDFVATIGTEAASETLSLPPKTPQQSVQTPKTSTGKTYRTSKNSSTAGVTPLDVTMDSGNVIAGC